MPTLLQNECIHCGQLYADKQKHMALCAQTTQDVRLDGVEKGIRQLNRRLADFKDEINDALKETQY